MKEYRIVDSDLNEATVFGKFHNDPLTVFHEMASFLTSKIKKRNPLAKFSIEELEDMKYVLDLLFAEVYTKREATSDDCGTTQFSDLVQTSENIALCVISNIHVQGTGTVFRLLRRIEDDSILVRIKWTNLKDYQNFLLSCGYNPNTRPDLFKDAVYNDLSCTCYWLPEEHYEFAYVCLTDRIDFICTSDHIQTINDVIKNTAKKYYSDVDK